MNQTIQFRPILAGKDYEDLPIWQKINWKWFLQRIPMFLFAFVSSYGVGHLLYLGGTPSPFDYIGAISFDIGYLGVIALADMQLKKTIKSNILFYILNITMSVLAALFNVLGHAGGKYANIRAEDITIGVPFALVGLAFAMYYHSIMAEYITKEIENNEQTKEPCKFCGVGKPSMHAIYGHYKSCSMKKMHETLNDPSRCSCLLCKHV